MNGRIIPDWPAPPNVRAFMTTRTGGVSGVPYSSMNLGNHVGDDPAAVAENRRRLCTELNLPAEPLWLSQVHGINVAMTGCDPPGIEADGAVGFAPGNVCAVLTADCLPVLFCDRAGTRVAAAHAGWRGLAAGVLDATLAALDCSPDSVMAWLGPAIGPDTFEVGDEVRAAFVAIDPAAAACFRPAGAERWLADLYALARMRLAGKGVTSVYGGGLCTSSDPQRFFSYRRDGVTGRMAALVWLA